MHRPTMTDREREAAFRRRLAYHRWPTPPRWRRLIAALRALARMRA